MGDRDEVDDRAGEESERYYSAEVEAGLVELFGTAHSVHIPLEEVLGYDSTPEEIPVDIPVIAATSKEAEELFSVLSEAGVLKLPVASEQEVRSLLNLADGPNPIIDKWGVWKTYQVQLERDLSVTDRICYRFSSMDTVPSLSKLSKQVDTNAGKISELTAEILEVKSLVLEIRAEIQKIRRNMEDQEGSIVMQLKTLSATIGDQQAALQVIQEQRTEVAAPILEFQEAVSKIEDRMRTYAEVARESQMVVLKEQECARQLEMDTKLKAFAEAAREAHVTAEAEREKEESARMARRLNLRVVGMTEESEEDTRAIVTTLFKDTLRVLEPGVVTAYRIGKREGQPRTILVKFDTVASTGIVFWNVRGLSDATKEGNNTLWQDVDIIALTETWSRQEELGVTFTGFTCLASVWNQKRGSRGRGFGGVAVWVKDGLEADIQVEHTDPLNQFLCLKLQNNHAVSFLLVAYFAPWGSPVCKTRECDSSPFLGISKIIQKIKGKGPIWVLGDFNSRVGWFQNPDLPQEGSSHRVRETAPACWDRWSDDDGRNQMADRFEEFLRTCDLTIVNGTGKFSSTRSYTYIGPAGSSVIDYLLASREARERVAEFTLGQLVPDSDHRPLICTILGFDKTNVVSRRKPIVTIVLRDDGKDRYERLVSNRLPAAGLDTKKVTQVLVHSIREVTVSSQVGRCSWFDADCARERAKTLTAGPQECGPIFCAYNHFIRAKKRKLIRAQQVLLEKEWMHSPQLFWARFRTRSPASDLSPIALREHVSNLYFFPEATPMPIPSGPVCTFTSDEVDSELRRMNVGRAADLFGLKIEFFRWGGEASEWGEGDKLRGQLTEKVLDRIWHNPSSRLLYYRRDIARERTLTEQAYLTESFPLKIRHLIAKYRISSHDLQVEVGRWRNIPREQRICTLCDLQKVENEYHVILACPRYSHIRISQGIDMEDLLDFFALPPFRVGLFLLSIDNTRRSACGYRY
ncbi:hypothetical protein R1sor_008965 [Riccia sorocarpa]|uniref:Endonuclease/exonuclease/phosphatase domain-containing protein n=1 Tax=Riccia sorocarpa TaxID=122646 RepID=A0ABD3H6B9_9MARC